MEQQKRNVQLDDAQKKRIGEILKSKDASEWMKKRARILLCADESDGSVSESAGKIAARVGVSNTAVLNAKRRFIKYGLERALHYNQKGQQKAHSMRLKKQKWQVVLDAEARTKLMHILESSTVLNGEKKRAQILLASDISGGRIPERVYCLAEKIGVTTATITATKRNFYEKGLEAALCRKRHVRR